MERDKSKNKTESIKIKFVKSLDSLSEVDSQIIETSQLNQNATYDAIFVKDERVHGKLFNANPRQLVTGIMEFGDLGYDIYVKKHEKIGK